MSLLLEKIRSTDRDAARVLESKWRFQQDAGATSTNKA